MKNKVLIAAIFITALGLVLGCNKNTNTVAAEDTGYSESINVKEDSTKGLSRNTLVLELDEGNNVSFESLTAFMTPKYDSESQDKADEKAKGSKKLSASDKKSDSVIPGIRNLGDYKTKYKAERQMTYTPAIQTSLDEKDDPNVVFTVADWGPQGKIPSQAENPSFYVVFSQPVHALSALEEPSDKSDVLTIDPALKGTFRWYGTKHLAFEAEEPADPAIEYEIKVNPETKSLGGSKIKGQTTFRTKAEQINITRLYGGYIDNGDSAYGYDSGALPPYENRFYIKLNYMLTQERLNELLTVKIGTSNAAFTSEPLFNIQKDKYGYSIISIKCDESANKTDSFVVTITDDVPHNASITAAIRGGNRSQTYFTLQPFKIDYISEYTDYSQLKKQNPLRISFNQIPDKDSIIENISFSFDYKLTEENFEIDGSTLTIFNLPINFGEEHRIFIKKTLKDIYGQELNYKGISSYKFKVRDAESYVKFLDYGSKMLEAQFPHKMIFEHQNLEPNSYYRVDSTEDPFNLQSAFRYNSDHMPFEYKTIPTETKNTRLFEEIDFEPYLKNGFGFVKFDALTNRRYFDNWSNTWDLSTNIHTMSVQVTDLGITARIGINKAVLMIRSLSTGKPVPNADVHIILPIDDDKNAIAPEKELAVGKTDDNGLCIISFTEKQIIDFESNFLNSYSDSLYVLVENGDDKAVFSPNSHSTWGFSVYTGQRKNVRQPKQRTYMFVDRGLYKPGETVTFRGIDRDQLLGTLKPHQGTYTITVSESFNWDSPNIICTIDGKTSESGGFYGSFKLPDDLEPGNYGILYARTDGSSGSKDTAFHFKVAEFERLKIQAGITVPEITYFGGDKLSAELEAEYLAGGSLNGAEYKASWYKQGKKFISEVPETKDYSFGPYNQYSWRNYYSDEKGKLSTNGTAQLGCTSEKITNGMPHEYRVEARVTDISNQSISVATSVLVHPSAFYVGLKPATNISGFAKKGQKLQFPFVLCNTKGELLQTDDLSAKVTALSYTLSRDEWTMVHEQSVNSSVYTRYEKTTVQESTGTINTASAGNLELTPENTGWYTLEISGTDNKNNPVLTSIGFYVTGSGMSWYGSSNSEELTLTPNQNLYNPGDTAQILLQSPLPKGDYLITVEREGIFTEEIRHFDESAAVIEVPIASNYVPVVYVAVSSYSDRNGPPTHQYGETDLDKPKGYFGVTALSVNPYVRSFSIDVECDKPTYKPGEEATITLKATKGGKPVKNAELTVMAVDRGVLDLINYHVPDPISFFYSEYYFPLCVKGGDSRALLMDPVTYSVKNLAGGDADAASDDEKEDERKDFRPTAVFEPSILTDDAGIAKVTFKMPDSLTTYRITAFGIKDDLFALKEDEAKVQNPINVQQVQPRKLRERDTAECGVLITNLDGEAQKVTVSLEVRTPVKNTAEDELAGRKTIPGKAFVDGKTTHTVTVQPGDSTVVYFDVGAEKKGTVELVYTIDSNLLKEKLVSPIKIEKTYIYETVTMIGSTGEDVPAVAKEAFVIPGFAKDGRGDLSITLDATRLGMLGTSVNYLFDYPYGCLEQQSSRILPLVIFDEYIDIFGLNSEVKDIKTVVTAHTKDWAKSQLKNGGFPYWPGSSYSSLYVSLRIAHICAAALQRGYTQDELGIDINNLVSYIATEVGKSKDNYLKAYACYVVKLLDRHNLDNTLAALYKQIDDLTLSAAAYVSLAYSEDYGLSSLSKSGEINNKLRAYLIPAERSVTVLSPNREADFWYWYESPAEQMAVLLQSFVKVDPNDQMVDRLLFTLMQNQSMGYWKNTTTTARVLEAFYTLIKMRNLDSTDFTGSASINESKVMTESFKGVGAKPKTLKLPFEGDIVSNLEKDKSIPITFEKEGDGQLYYTVEMTYALPDEMQFARNEGIKIVYEITDYETGEVIKTSTPDDSLLTLESGKLYRASVRVESTRNRTYLALRAPIPSGAEILDSTFVTTGAEGEVEISSDSYGHWLSNKIIWDNEIQFFWDNFRTGSSTVSFTFRAARRGVYPTPPVQAECMYEPEIFGRSDGYLILIK